MSRRIVRSGLQLGLIAFAIFFLLYLIDSRFEVLPATIHNRLPAHHPGLVITDITLYSCTFGKCQLPTNKWHRIEKDLYLNTGWLSKAYLHTELKKEEDLTSDDRVVIDVRVGRIAPPKPTEDEIKWESRPGGIWLKRSGARHASDAKSVVTSVDVLFGVDAVDPRLGWELKENALLLDYGQDSIEARMTIRRGQPQVHDKPTVRVKRDGTFKIMQSSDLHVSTGTGICRDPVPPGWKGGKCEADPRTLEFMGRLLDEEQPDLVILSGDQINGETSPDAQSGILKIADLLIKRKIPYAAILGNHDDEGNLSRLESIQLWSSLPYSLTSAGPDVLGGTGNYYIQVMSHTGHHSALTIWMFDTHSYSSDEKKYPGYDWIKTEQIAWFKEVAKSIKGDNDKYSHIHLDMAFIHIPIPEYRESGLMIGSKNESIEAPYYNSNMFEALLEMDIPVLSCGHDHVNDFCMFPDRHHLIMPPKPKVGDEKDTENEQVKETSAPMRAAMTDANINQLEKIWLCYAGGAGMGGYGGYGGYIRRIRFFELDANAGRMITWKKLEYGETTKRIDEQMVVDDGKAVIPKVAAPAVDENAAT